MAHGIRFRRDGSGDGHIQKTKRPRRPKPRISAYSPPALQPKAPATDFRVGATVSLSDGVYDRGYTEITKRIQVFAAGADPNVDTPLNAVSATTAPGVALEYTLPAGPAGRFLRGVAIPKDDLGRTKVTIYTEDLPTILATADPRNVTPPSQSGTGYVGETLTLDPGIWENATVRTVRQRNGVDVPGTADTTSYAPPLAELDQDVGWRVWADGLEAETSITVPPIRVKVHALRTSNPSISGLDTVGSVLTRIMGTCVGTDAAMTGSWQKGTVGVDIPGETGENYTLQSGDVGAQVSWHDWAIYDKDGTARRSSSITVRSATSQPFNITPPQLSGAAVEGSVLTVGGDTWDLGTPAGTVQQNWQLNTAGTWADISGATSRTYTSLHAQAGSKLRCGVWVSTDKPGTIRYTGEITVEAAGVVFGSYVPRSAWKVVQTDTPNPGSREARFGTGAGADPGGAASTPAGFNRYVTAALHQIGDADLGNANLLVNPSGNDTISMPNAISDDTMVFGAIVDEHIASGQRKLMTDPNDKVTLNGTQVPYGACYINHIAPSGIHTLQDFVDAYTAIGNGAGTIALASDFDATEHVWAVNRAGSLNNPLIIESVNPDRPATFRGLSIAQSGLKGNFAHLGNKPQANSVSGVVFQWVNFTATRLTKVQERGTRSKTQPGVGNGPIHDLVAAMGDGSGIGFSVSGTEHPAAAFCKYGSSDGDMSGLRFGTGTSGMQAKDCTFNGFSNAFSVAGSNVLLSQGMFRENAEDMVRIGGGSNQIYEWNWCTDFRSLTYEQATWFGIFDDKDAPPHADYFQTTSGVSNITFRHNYLYDAEGRIHNGLINSAGGDGGKQSNIVVDNNESQQTHANGWWIGHCNNLTVTRNKHFGLNNSNPSINLQNSTDAAITGTKVYQNNVATSFQGGISGGSNGNVATGRGNGANTYGAGFQQIRKDKVTGGARYVGPGGNG